jgi:hypothetical protein
LITSTSHIQHRRILGGRNEDGTKRKEFMMPAIPSSVLRKLYVTGSLRAEDDGFALELKNTIAPATIVAFNGLNVDGQPMELTQVTLAPPDGDPRPVDAISEKAPVSFPINAILVLSCASGETLEPGPHELIVHAVVREVGPIDIPVSDALA